MVGLCFYSRLIFGWHQVCDAVLNIKHGGTGTKTAFTLVQVLHRLSTITIPSGISSYFTHEVSPVFLRSAFVLNASKNKHACIYKFRAQHLINSLARYSASNSHKKQHLPVSF